MIEKMKNIEAFILCNQAEDLEKGATYKYEDTTNAYKSISDLLEAEIAKSEDEIIKVCLNGDTEAEFPLKITEFTIMGRVSKDTIAHYRNYQSGNTQKNVFTLCGDLQSLNNFDWPVHLIWFPMEKKTSTLYTELENKVKTYDYIDDLIKNLPAKKPKGFYLYRIRGAHVLNKDGTKTFQYMICDNDADLLAKLTKTAVYTLDYYPDWFKVLHIEAIHNYGYNVSQIQNYYNIENIYDGKNRNVNKAVIKNIKLPTKEEYDHAMCVGYEALEQIADALMIVLNSLSYRCPSMKTAILENETFTKSIIYEQVINTLINDRRKVVRNAAIDYYCRQHAMQQ